MPILPRAQRRALAAQSRQAVGVRVTANANSPITWLRTDFRFQPGEGL
jgi:hypothetical protein